MPEIEFLLSAQDDVIQAVAWYDSQLPRLGERFRNDLVTHLDIIVSSPLLFSIRYDSVRTVVLSDFPFMIHYIVEANRVLVVAVLHTSLDPDTWRKRKEQY